MQILLYFNKWQNTDTLLDQRLITYYDAALHRNESNYVFTQGVIPGDKVLKSVEVSASFSIGDPVIIYLHRPYRQGVHNECGRICSMIIDVLNQKISIKYKLITYTGIYIAEERDLSGYTLTQRIDDIDDLLLK